MCDNDNFAGDALAIGVIIHKTLFNVSLSRFGPKDSEMKTDHYQYVDDGGSEPICWYRNTPEFNLVQLLEKHNVI